MVLKRDLPLKINAVQIAGVGVVPQADKYTIEFAADDAKTVIVKTCHRHERLKPNRGRVAWEYVPTEIEDEICPLEIGIFALAEKNTWVGYVDFADIMRNEMLTAEVHCNGKSIPARGAAICQGYAGTYQEIRFDKPVESTYTEGCAPVPSGGMVFRYRLSKSYCHYLFTGYASQLRLTTLGYTESMLRD